MFETDGDTDDDPIKWTGPNLSTIEQKERFDRFLIEESETGSESGAINAPIKLKIEGQYTYKIYESEVETLDVNLTTGRILEQGMLRVRKDEEAGDFDDVYLGK